MLFRHAFPVKGRSGSCRPFPGRLAKSPSAFLLFREGERRDSGLPPTLPHPARPVSKRSAPPRSTSPAGAKAASLSPVLRLSADTSGRNVSAPHAPPFFFGTSVRTVLEAPRQPGAVSQNAARSNARPSPEDSHGKAPGLARLQTNACLARENGIETPGYT